MAAKTFDEVYLVNYSSYDDVNLYEVGCQKCDPSYGYGPIIRKLYILHYVVSGEGILRINNHEFAIKEHDIFVIPAHTASYYEADENHPWNYIWIQFDGFKIKDDIIEKTSNHAGGILGGMSDGSQIILRAAVKPTPSIARSQDTVNKLGENININIKGRHDPIIVPRAVVVVESMVAITLVDMLFTNMTSRIDKIVDFYKQTIKYFNNKGVKRYNIYIVLHLLFIF